MPAVHIRDIDDAVLTALKARAAEHGRSLQQELRAVLEAAADPHAGSGRRLKLHTVRVGGNSTFSRDEIADDD